MVGHTGSMQAAIKACEAVDQCVEKVVQSALKNEYTTILIADHGNCETMINPDGSPNTAHTTNPVPVIIIDNDIKNMIETLAWCSPIQTYEKKKNILDNEIHDYMKK